MKGYIANTDQEWFDFLARRGAWPEVNFWNPSDFYAFRGALGSPFLFRLKSPRNAIGGFGFVQGFARMPEWWAWQCFGEANGAPTEEAFTARIARLRQGAGIQASPGLRQIGCILLRDAVFFPREMWIPQPSDWGRANLRYKGYDLTAGEGKRVWDHCLPAAVALAPPAGADLPQEPDGPRYGQPIVIRPRLGQGGFRVAVTDAYDRACAVTHEHSLPVLEAAHIKPFAQEGPHATSNGLLLRSDLHRLFDTGYLTVAPNYRLEVSRRLKEDFDNGKSYYPLHGTLVTLPRRAADRPDPGLLAWHSEHVFRG
ncbi:MAG: HNH endonuclease [Acidobacteria bacterium]|nr:HNH endonuclease [Acidobacteriota bacterium]